MSDIPMLKRATLTKPLGVVLPEETRKRIMDLKHVYNVDHQAWLRGLIDRELPLLEKKLKPPA